MNLQNNAWKFAVDEKTTMRWDEYILKSARTVNPDLTTEQQISNAIFGLHGELGEVTDLLKKHLYQGHTISKDRLDEEIGDVMFYLAWLCRLYKVDLETVLHQNFIKLYKRYPEGFDVIKSVEREG